MTKIIRISGTRKIIWNKKRFELEFDKFPNLEMDFISYLDYYYDWNWKNIKTWEVLPEQDIYRISWGIWTNWFWIRAWLNYYFWKLKWKKILDPINYNITDTSKFQQLLFLNHHKYWTPKTLFFQITKEYKSDFIDIAKQNFSFPMIAKDLYKDRWKGVFLIENEEQLWKKIDEYNHKWLLLQEYIKNEWEFRILIVGNEIWWIFKRYNPNSYRNNVIKWAVFENKWISKDMEEKMIEITKSYWLDFAGIDLIIANNQYYILEINSAPQFKRLEEITWENIAYKLLNYLCKPTS